MVKLHVALPGDAYDISIGEGLLKELGAAVSRPDAGPAAVVTDEHVWPLYGPAVTEALKGAGVPFGVVVLPPGEESKSLETLGRLYHAFADAGLTRESVAVALGGGVVGDLCGLAAATYMRGIRCVQVPTTLLAQVDSSVGGKTAVNLPQGKNLVGAFCQPAAVLVDPRVLATLPPREFRSGMAEVIKYGAIRSKGLLEQAMNPPDGMEGIIAECCRIKRDIVERDEREAGERMLLNFGHTFGHALEKRMRYACTHGEAVAVGMVVAARLGELAGVTAEGTARELEAVLEAGGLKTRCPVPPAELVGELRHDKKSGAGGVTMVLLRALGEALLVPLSFARVEELARKAAW